MIPHRIVPAAAKICIGFLVLALLVGATTGWSAAAPSDAADDNASPKSCVPGANRQERYDNIMRLVTGVIVIHGADGSGEWSSFESCPAVALLAISDVPAVLSDQIGASPEELLQAYATGEGILTLAESRGVDLPQLRPALQQALADAADAAVANDTISQGQSGPLQRLVLERIVIVLGFDRGYLSPYLKDDNPPSGGPLPAGFSSAFTGLLACLPGETHGNRVDNLVLVLAGLASSVWDDTDIVHVLQALDDPTGACAAVALLVGSDYAWGSHLQMTAPEIAAAYQNCQSLSDIARAQGVDDSVLIGQLLTALAAEADAQVAAGRLDKQAAKRMVDGMNGFATDWQSLLTYNHCDLLN